MALGHDQMAIQLIVAKVLRDELASRGNRSLIAEESAAIAARIGGPAPALLRASVLERRAHNRPDHVSRPALMAAISCSAWAIDDRQWSPVMAFKSTARRRRCILKSSSDCPSSSFHRNATPLSKSDTQLGRAGAEECSSKHGSMPALHRPRRAQVAVVRLL